MEEPGSRCAEAASGTPGSPSRRTALTPGIPGEGVSEAALDPEVLLRLPGARLMVLAPHPDDESLAAGGLIQRALTCGAQVSVVFVTDGENNPWPQRLLERRAWVGHRQRADWACRRRGESERALHALGASVARIHRLGWPDGGLTWMLLANRSAMLDTMRALLERERPSLLVLPDLVDRHPDHSAIHVLTEMAFQNMPGVRRPECLAYVVHGLSPPDTAHRAVLLLTPFEQARKREAIRAHASQIALGHGRLMRCASRTERFVSGFDHKDRADPNLPWSPPPIARRCLALLVVDAHGCMKVALDGAGVARLHWRDGSLAAWLPRQLRPPYYVKLFCLLPSPWIFDTWGWCRFGTPRA